MANASSSLALQRLTRDAERAGAAMGCYFGGSDEFEAALIAERRRAGAYRRPRGMQAGVWVLSVSGAAALLGLPFVW